MPNQNLYLEKIREIEASIEAKKFFDALDFCKKLIEDQAFIEQEEVYLLLSRIYFSLKKYEEAQLYFSKVSDTSLKDNKYYFLKGQIFEKLEDFESAEHGYYVAVRKIPKNRKYLKKYIEYVCKFKYYDLAIQKIEKIVSSKPEKSFYLNLEIAKFHIEKKDLKKAFFILKNMKALNGLEQDLINEVCSIIYESFGDYENALKKIDCIQSPDIFQALKKDELSFNHQIKRIDNIFDFYNFNFIKGNSVLTIVFSSIENKFILKGYSFNSSMLFVSEKLMTYYTYQYENMIQYIARIIKENGIEKVNLVGSSKGSFAAINISLGLEEILDQQEIRVVAFSPQAYIYPLNVNIKGLPSYKTLLKLSKKYILMNSDLSSFGNPVDRMYNTKVDIKIVYGGAHSRDKIEAENFSGFSNVTLLPIQNYPFHTSLLIYTKKGEKLKEALTRKIDSRSKDDHFFRPNNNEILICEILNKVDIYEFDLNNLLLKEVK